jgi:hypothetical protein
MGRTGELIQNGKEQPYQIRGVSQTFDMVVFGAHRKTEIDIPVMSLIVIDLVFSFQEADGTSSYIFAFARAIPAIVPSGKGKR